MGLALAPRDCVFRARPMACELSPVHCRLSSRVPCFNLIWLILGSTRAVQDPVLTLGHVCHDTSCTASPVPCARCGTWQGLLGS
jgi:hypothetical protein